MALLRSTENEGPLCGHSCQCRGNDVGIKEGRIKSSSASSEIHLFFNTFPVKTQTHKKKNRLWFLWGKSHLCFHLQGALLRQKSFWLLPGSGMSSARTPSDHQCLKAAQPSLCYAKASVVLCVFQENAGRRFLTFPHFFFCLLLRSELFQ